MKILLALDTSTASCALEELVARPWPTDSSVEVLSVVVPSHLWTTSEVAQEAARRAEDVVERSAEQLRHKGWEATGATLSGDPKTAILDRVREIGADFLIVGSNGVSGLLLGNVAATTLRYAPCSVEIVRARVKNEGQDGMKVLLATDGSEYSEQAARSIMERPWPVATEVRVLSAVELILPATRAFLELPLADSAFMESARGEAMKRSQDAIARAVQILSSTALAVSESISVLWDKPKTIILDEATRWGADLIVMGSHGRRGLDRFLLGSVSEAVATHAKCSVEVIRNAG
jgi:nucleotide-binding universal stress UspA family protein